MKYIIVQAGKVQLPVLFPELVQHKDMAAAFNHPVVSAGFVQLDKRNRLEVLGASIGLQLHSRPSDIDIINLELEPLDFVVAMRGL